MRKYILITLATLTLASCLDEDPRDRLPEEDVFATSTDLYLNAVANLYNYIGGHEDGQGLQGTTRGIYDLNTFTSDEAILPTSGGDWYDGGLWLSLYMHTFDAGTAPIENSWNYLYKVIVLCNHSLDYLQKYNHLIPTDQQAPLQAEVRGIRALCYFYLLDLFGRVPWVNSSGISMNETDQLSRHRLFWKLYDEVNEILPHLPLVRSNMLGNYYGRITAPVMWFILAKMTLNAEIWTDDIWTDDQHLEGDNILFTIAGEQMTAWEACIYYCGLLTNFGYKLEPAYSTNFNTRNESSLENIFTIPMDKTLYTNQFKYLFRSRHNNHGAALGMASENGTCATVSAVRTYGYGTDYVDNRYYMNFISDSVYVDDQLVLLDNGEPLVYKPLAVQPDLTGSPYEKTAGARMFKYETDRTAYNDGLLQSNDIVLFRYADVLLMVSEAKVRAGQNGDKELNMVRERALMDYRPATLDNILDERLMELQWEGWRRQDLIRFDRFHRAYDMREQVPNEDDRHTIVFPIPGGAIDLNKRLSQNPGY